MEELADPRLIPVARTIAPSDNSTSIVIDGSGPQIESGMTPLTTYSDIVYDALVALKLDLQVPKTPNDKSLIVYITGGGFVVVDKSANLNQRTYVAEQGYAVASLEYRTVSNGATYRDAVSDVKSAIDYPRTLTSTRSARARSRCGDSPRVATLPR